MGSKPKFEFQHIDGEEFTLESAVFQALGFASTCWESLEGTGVFESTAAKECGEALVAWIKNNYVHAPRVEPEVVPAIYEDLLAAREIMDLGEVQVEIRVDTQDQPVMTRYSRDPYAAPRRERMRPPVPPRSE